MFLVLLLIGCERIHNESQDRLPDAIHVRHYYESGQVMREFYIGADSIKVGRYVNYYPNGNIRQEEYYQRGVKDGIQKAYFLDGTLESINAYAMGHMNGPYEWYYPNGQIKTRGVRKDDQVEGEVLGFYESGSARSFSNYKKGRKVGKEKLLYEDGGIWSVTYYSSIGTKGFQMNYTRQGEIDTYSGSPILGVEAKGDSFKRNIKTSVNLAVPEGTKGALSIVRRFNQEEGESLESAEIEVSQTVSFGDDYRHTHAGKYTYVIEFHLTRKDDKRPIGTFESKFYVLHGRSLAVYFP